MKHIARKRFGQNFLHDASAIAAIVDAIGPKPGDALIEIGPGLGALTRPLREQLGRMTVVEIDRDLAARLRNDPQLRVIESDVLRVDFAELHAEMGASGGLRIVGNLPYNVSTPILFHLLAFAHCVQEISSPKYTLVRAIGTCLSGQRQALSSPAPVTSST